MAQGNIAWLTKVTSEHQEISDDPSVKTNVNGFNGPKWQEMHTYVSVDMECQYDFYCSITLHVHLNTSQ